LRSRVLSFAYLLVFWLDILHAIAELDTVLIRTHLCLPVSSEISDLCEIFDLLLFVSYFASQKNEIRFGNNFFDVCCVN